LIALMRRHEIGHCNGWPGHHPNARSVEYGRGVGKPVYTDHVTVTLF
jgi:hypothetical protein